jgi:hypothetical protein
MTDKEPSSARNHLLNADAAIDRAKRKLSQTFEMRESITRLRVRESIPPVPPTVLEKGWDGIMRIKR